jgi:hypothetical protein
MAAVRQDHLGASLQANATFILPFHILAARLRPIIHPPPSHHVFASTLPFQVPLDQTTLKLLQNRVDDRCSARTL